MTEKDPSRRYIEVVNTGSKNGIVHACISLLFVCLLYYTPTGAKSHKKYLFRKLGQQLMLNDVVTESRWVKFVSMVARRSSVSIFVVRKKGQHPISWKSSHLRKSLSKKYHA